MPHLLDRVQTALSDRYVIEREMGSGGMSTVYLARDLEHNRRVAVKVLRPEMAATIPPERFLREVEIAGKIENPHLVPVLDSGEAGGVFFYVMSYVDGETLEDRLKREGRLPLRDALAIGEGIAVALEALHSANVIHRDVKPSNIFLPFDPSGPVSVLGDLGLVGVLEDNTRLTQPGIIAGTPYYMSPEQVSGEAQSTAADIYGFGAVLYEILFGEPPFVGSNIMEVLYQQKATQVGIPSSPNVPKQVVAFITQCLSKEPRDRPKSPAAELRRLREMLTAPTTPVASPPRYSKVNTPIPTPQTSAPPTKYKRMPEPPARSKRIPSVAVGVVGVIFVVATGILLFGVGGRRLLRLWDSDIVTGVSAGLALAFGGIILGLVVRKLLGHIRTRLQKEGDRLLAGAETRGALTRSLVLEVDELMNRCREIDERFLGKSLAIMVGEYQDAKNFTDRQAALVTAVQFLDKLMDRLKPWYVRYEKLIAVVVSLVGVVSGAVKVIVTIRQF